MDTRNPLQGHRSSKGCSRREFLKAAGTGVPALTLVENTLGTTASFPQERRQEVHRRSSRRLT